MLGRSVMTGKKASNFKQNPPTNGLRVDQISGDDNENVTRDFNHEALR